MTAKNQLAIVSNSGWNIYNFRAGLIRKLQECGYSIIVMAGKDAYFDRIKELFNVELVPLMNMDETGMNPYREWKLYKELESHYRNYRPDLIFQFTIKPNIYGSLAAKKLGIEVISNVTGLGVVAEKKHFLSLVLDQLYRYALKSNYEVVFHNQDDLDWFRHRKMLPVGLGCVIQGSGVDSQFFKREKANTTKRSFVALMVGRMVRQKGVWEFFKACELLVEQGKSLECWMAGFYDPFHPDALSPEEMEIMRSKAFVRLFDFQEDVRPLLNQAQVFVLPSYREGLSKAMLEAMSMELPILTTKVPGCRQAVLEGINGLLVEAKDIKGLAAALRKFMEFDLQTLQCMGSKSRAFVLENFDTQHMVRGYLDLLDRIAGRQSSTFGETN